MVPRSSSSAAVSANTSDVSASSTTITSISSATSTSTASTALTVPSPSLSPRVSANSLYTIPSSQFGLSPSGSSGSGSRPAGAALSTTSPVRSHGSHGSGSRPAGALSPTSPLGGGSTIQTTIHTPSPQLHSRTPPTPAQLPQLPQQQSQRPHQSKLSLRRFFKRKSPSGASAASARSASAASGSGALGIRKRKSNESVSTLHSHEELLSKYGKPGRSLGEGAGGSVQILENQHTGELFAIKKFRARNAAKQNLSTYKKKLMNEYSIGAGLHHENVIRTLDLLEVDECFYIVMEYAPYDFFSLVMSGLISKHENFCYFKQLVHGVAYLHSKGLAHRDLKLDNCVVNSNQILKIIDFGSATHFRYSSDQTRDIVYCREVVGSDPYLAPEVLSGSPYNPAAADIWSVGIIYCCMVLRRFPWKIPNDSDTSYKNFTAVPEVDPSNPDHVSRSKGPYRLIKQLPHGIRHLISKMLDTDPSTRVSVDALVADDWFKALSYCHFDSETGKFVKHSVHDHHLIIEEP